ncbi:hypothetical protein DFJ74DRAFT_712437 [Hyaloraphidium curvatum]|nr:hypothetical protein DFJ74DRAFT_712437 [Hyaloraphidium curvatum]
MGEPVVTVQETVTETETLFVDEAGRPLKPADDEAPVTQQDEGRRERPGQPEVPTHVYEEAPESPTSNFVERDTDQTVRTERGPDTVIDDSALAALQQKHGKLTLVKFQDPEVGAAAFLSNSAGSMISKIYPEGMVEEAVEDPMLASLESIHGKLTISRFVNDHGALVSTEIWAGNSFITKGVPGEAPPKPMGPIDRGSLLGLVVLGVITLLFLVQLGFGVYSRETGKLEPKTPTKVKRRLPSPDESKQGNGNP